MLFEKNNSKPRKKAYYPFSKNYPSKSGNIYAIGESRTRHKKEKRNKAFFYISLVFIFCIVFVVASVSFRLSRRAIDTGNGNRAAEYNGMFKAYRVPDDALEGGIAYNLFRSELSKTNANAVLIDFKKSDGTLVYKSANITANEIGASANSDNALNVISQLKADGYKIIARISCYEDSLASSMLTGAQVTENGTNNVWLDDSAQNDGNPWLNPYSEIAEKYLLNIIEESVSKGADAVMLSGLSFPSGDRVQSAFFNGEADSTESRNGILHSFVTKAAERVGDIPIIVCMTADSAVNGNETLYSGGMFDSDAVFNAVDYTVASTDTVTIGENTYQKGEINENGIIQSTYPILKEKAEENYTTKGIIPIIDDESYIATLKNLGIENYIVIKP